MQFFIRLVGVGFLFVAAWPTGVAAQTVGVRITAPEAVVREKADVQSASIATVKAGTVLEVVAERTGWYEVILPATGGNPQRRGYVAEPSAERFDVGLRATLGRAGGSASSSAAGPGGQPAADWQGRYNRAVGRRRSGVAMFWIGGPMALAGGALSFYALIKDVRSSEEERAARSFWDLQGPSYALVAGGVALTAIGQRRMSRAASELLLLENERTRAQQGVVYSRPLSEGKFQTALDLNAGPRVSAAVRMSW